MENIQPADVELTMVPVVTIEDLADLDGGATADAAAVASTHNCGGTFGTATCPASIGSAFSFT
jgi:hypothetical protein